MNNTLEMQAPSNITYGRGYAYCLQYHIVWATKYRKAVLCGSIETDLKDLLLKYAAEQDIKICAMEVMPDHVHLLIDCNPRYGITRCVANLKQKSSSELRHQFPDVIRGSASIWTRSSFIATVGSVSLETVKNYILSQKDHV